jgi:hypothetical protein
MVLQARSFGRQASLRMTFIDRSTTSKPVRNELDLVFPYFLLSQKIFLHFIYSLSMI